jgi:hypothetical protein
MAIPIKLPTREEIAKDLSGWKDYTKSLNNIVNEVDKFVYIGTNPNFNINVMKSMFEKDFSGWKDYIKALNDIVDEVDNFLSIDTNPNYNITIMKSMFKKYVSPSYPDKQFNPDAVTEAKDTRNQIHYIHEGVSMIFNERFVMCYLIDCD